MHPFFAPRAPSSSAIKAVVSPSREAAPQATKRPLPYPDVDEEDEVSLSSLKKSSMALASSVGSAAAGVASLAAAAPTAEPKGDSSLSEGEAMVGDVSTSSSAAGVVQRKKTIVGVSGGFGNDEAFGYTGYHPVKDAGWGNGEPTPGAPVPYAALVAMFERVGSKTARLYKTGQFANFLRSLIALSPADVLPALYLTNATLAPAFMGIELGVGDSVLGKALSETTGRKLAEIREEVKAADGDYGPTAEAARSKQRTLAIAGTPNALTIRGVYASFRSIAAESGKSSQDKKVATIKKMLVAAKGVEARYIMRGLQCKLRIGLTGKTVPVALAHAVFLTAPLVEDSISSSSSSSSSSSLEDPYVYNAPGRGDFPPVRLAPVHCGGLSKKHISPESWEAMQTSLDEASEALKAIWSELPSYDAIVPHLLRGGIALARARCQLTPGIPVAPMLAKPTKGVAEVLDRLEGKPFTCEYKYDGERAQIHGLKGGAVKIFSRNSEEMSSKYPDLAQTLALAMGRGETEEAATTAAAPAIHSSQPPPVLDCILDGESIAYDRESGRLLPFQVLSTRSRKDATLESIKVPVIYVAFDLLYLNGESLLGRTLEERRAALRSAFREIPGRFTFAASKEGTDTEEIGGFLNEAIAGGCEGLMIKTLQGADSLYAPDRRSLNWLKLKKDYMEGLSDSLDLVPVAAWDGRGKRAGVYGAYLLACYDPDTDEYQSVCKVGTGFSEANLESLAQGLAARGCTRGEKPPNVNVGENIARTVDVWFSPEESEVWEIKAADLSISPVHMGAVGKVNPEKGIGLRFPRFLHKRVDKAPQDATTSDQVLDMYRAQSTVKGKGGEEEEEDD